MTDSGIIWIERRDGYECRPPTYPWRISIIVRKDGQIAIGEYGQAYWTLEPNQVRELIRHLEAALEKVEGDAP